MNDDRTVGDITAHAGIRVAQDGSVLVDSLPYGGLGIDVKDGTIQQTVVANVWETMNFAHSERYSTVIPDPAVGTLVPAQAGLYLVTFTCTLTCSGQSAQYWFALMKNGLYEGVRCGVFLYTGQYHSGAFSCFKSAVKGDAFNVNISAASNDTATIEQAQFNMVRVGAIAQTLA